MPTASDLANEINGKSLSITGADAGQCTAVPHRWSQLLGLPIVYGNAVDIYGNMPDSVYAKEVNTPTGVPRPGSVIVWHQDARVGTGQYGHVAVVLSANVNTFDVIEQNSPVGAKCRIHRYPNYAGVTGWGFPRVLEPQPVAPAPQPAPVPVVDAVSAPVEPGTAPVVVPVTSTPTDSQSSTEPPLPPTPPAPGTIIQPVNENETVEPQEVVQVPAPAPKPGLKTTEFWIVVALTLIPIVKHLFGIELDPNTLTALVTSLAASVGSVTAAVLYVKGRIDAKTR